jgi:HEAT repeat protein
VGIFDKFRSYRENKQKDNAERLGTKLKTVLTTKDDRLEAIDVLSKMPAEIAIPQLIKRFEMVVDHAIQDMREKEMVCDILLQHKEQAKPYVRESMAKARHIGWPIKLAERMFSADEFLSLLMENMKENTVEFDEIGLDRNIEIMLALKEIQNEKIVQKALPFLQTRDDNLRMATVECLEAQGPTSAEARTAIVELLKEPATDDNSRFLGLVKGIVQRHNWQA